VRECQIEVAIQQKSSGIVATHSATGHYDENGFMEFMWSEGNWSCDCNRAAFFREALGRPKAGFSLCGKSRYRIVSIRDKETGEVVYEETE
jgi:hypothetical protein